MSDHHCGLRYRIVHIPGQEPDIPYPGLQHRILPHIRTGKHRRWRVRHARAFYSVGDNVLRVPRWYGYAASSSIELAAQRVGKGAGMLTRSSTLLTAGTDPIPVISSLCAADTISHRSVSCPTCGRGTLWNNRLVRSALRAERPARLIGSCAMHARLSARPPEVRAGNIASRPKEREEYGPSAREHTVVFDATRTIFGNPLHAS